MSATALAQRRGDGPVRHEDLRPEVVRRERRRQLARLGHEDQVHGIVAAAACWASTAPGGVKSCSPIPSPFTADLHAQDDEPRLHAVVPGEAAGTHRGDHQRLPAGVVVREPVA